MSARALAFQVLGCGPVTDMAVRLSKDRMRVLAYHGIPDPTAFEDHLVEISDRFTPVSGAQVAAALSGRHRLPSRAIWLTFDDGFPEVETLGRPLLERFGITATLFVCPGVIDTDEPYWWEVVREAARIGITDESGSTVRGRLEYELKTVPDDRRRAVVAWLEEAIRAHQQGPYRRSQMTSKQLLTWAEAGQEVGNHTWDHPLLDQCSEDEQEAQVRRADDWLRDALGSRRRFFAYPNGNWTAVSEGVLRERDYDVALGFDHRLATADAQRLRISRLRLDSDAPLGRFRAVTSGIHTALLDFRSRVTNRERCPSDPRRLDWG